MTKKLSAIEEILISMNNSNQYNTYRCLKDGIYQVRKDVTSTCCPYCGTQAPLFKN